MGIGFEYRDYLSGDSPNYVAVQVTADSATENGKRLIEAYAKAKTLTPNGAALSATNRACVIVPPGKYNLDYGGDSPAPGNITVTPDAVGANPVTWYYTMCYVYIDYVYGEGVNRSLFSTEATFQVGDSTTTLTLNCDAIPSWADAFYIALGTTSGIYPDSSGDATIPFDIYSYLGNASGDYATCLALPVHQDCIPLTLDTQYVDIIGLTTDRALQHIYGTPAALNSGVIIQTANDVHISNLTVEILTAYGTPQEDNTDSAAYFPSTNLSNTVVDNCYFIGDAGGETVLWSMRYGVLEYSGTFTNCTGGDSSFGINGTASGTFTNCTGGDDSFGINGTASGTFTNCTGGDGSFGSYGGTASGTFTNCTGGDDSFGGASGIMSGILRFCVISNEMETPVASVVIVEIASGGTNYEVDDELTVVGGTGTAATLKVTSVNSGVIDGISILTVGAYTAEPSNPVATTGHTEDATFNLTWNEGHIYGCVDSTGFIAELNWND